MNLGGCLAEVAPAACGWSLVALPCSPAPALSLNWALASAQHPPLRLRAMDAPGAPAPAAAPSSARKELKIVIVGDGGCGKTSLLMVYCQGSFPEVRPAWWPEG